MDDPIITKLKEVHGLSEEQILTIIDEDAFMNALYRAEQNNIALRYECRKQCSDEEMFAIQWATQALTKNPRLFTSPKVPPVESIMDLDPEMFGGSPEISYFIETEEIELREEISVEQALKLAAVTSFTENPVSIFNPRNIYDFYSSYESGRIENVKIKFQIEEDQADAIYRYMNEYVIPKIANWEDAGGSASMRAFAKLGSIALTKSIEYLRDFLPFELESRYLATWFYMNPNPGSCSTIVGGVSSDQEQIEGICRQFDFTQLDDIRMWYSAMFFGPNSEQYDGLRKMTGLSNI